MPRRPNKRMPRCSFCRLDGSPAKGCRRGTSVAGQTRYRQWLCPDPSSINSPMPLGSKIEHCAFRRKTKKNLADRFEVRLAAFVLLNDRMDVTEPPLKGVAFKDRRRTGRVIGRIDGGARLVDGP